MKAFEKRMLNSLMNIISGNGSDPERYSGMFREISVAARTILVSEGDAIKSIFFIRKGCLRLWFNDQGKDITYQFFLENQVVSGFLDNEKSDFYLESIEPSEIVIIRLKDFETLLDEIPGLKDQFIEYLSQRLTLYSRLFMSRIRDTPARRYENLMEDHPEILQRIPQHYIATFLGITPVSLSRIRGKKTGG
jgi:CRP-like cAMP-binding protein